MNSELHDDLLDLLVSRLDEAATAAQLVDWATHALEAGLESESLVRLAGLPRDVSIYDATPLLDRCLTELDIEVPNTQTLRRVYVGMISRAVLAGRVRTGDALDRIHQRAVGPLGHPPDLTRWCLLWEGLQPDDYRSLEDDEIEAEVRRLASAWAHYRIETRNEVEPDVDGGPRKESRRQLRD
ncbi:MAG TPA: hypothetical protein VFH26_04390 [Gemmatimonadales bacterium]|nr:hypothetical protein [Gemmatimonadales bacterium]